MSNAWWATLQADNGLLLARLRALIAVRSGLSFPAEREQSLLRAIESVGKQQGFVDARACVAAFVAEVSTAPPLQLLINQLTIGETYFFRDPTLFAALHAAIFPALIDAHRRTDRTLRIWSAGCSTGEEAYSLAIALTRRLLDWRDWTLTLVATDINPLSLAKATLARYGPWSFRSGLPSADDNYFEKISPRLFAVRPPINGMVRFIPLNLVESSYAARADFRAMDIILCRNVLMYLEPAHQQAVIEKLSAALADGGWLVLSAVEAALVAVPQLVAVRLHDVVVFKKMAAPMDSGFAMPLLATVAVVQVPAPVLGHTNIPRSAPPPMPPSSGAPSIAPSIANSVALLAQARASADRGQLVVALDYCRQALTLDKLNADCTDLMASILLEQGDYAAAEAALQRSLYLDRDRVMSHVTLANLLLQQPAQRAAAQRHFRSALDVLAATAAQQIVPASDGLTVEQLRAMIQLGATCEATP